MKILLVEDMDQSRLAVSRLVKCRTGVVPVAPETWLEFLDIPKRQIKFDIALLDGRLDHWQSGLGFKHASGYVLEMLQWPGTVIGISIEQNIILAMELEFAAIVPPERKASFRFIKGGKDRETLFAALDLVMYAQHSAK